MKHFVLLLAACLFAGWGQAQTLPVQPLGPKVQVRTPMPPIQLAGDKLELADITTLAPNAHVLFKRIPELAELSRMTHSRNRGVIVLNLAAVPTFAGCMRLVHQPRGWKMMMILPKTMTPKDLLSFRHLRTKVEVVVPGLDAAQLDALLKPYKNASRSTIPEHVCAELMTF